ncbi:hypothetical protein BC831DRAFT_444619 [Entophlyctis helioformis]|nr:hypothetical protein BC831DRAFT_472539 [Entophlyctis helioformis]KAI8929295.1 hypothetical protein BC831DRAFT_444619 [Entophlyctis helioformis]
MQCKHPPHSCKGTQMTLPQSIQEDPQWPHRLPPYARMSMETPTGVTGSRPL